jgi:HAD superfamily hydrolase (TIGR01549 family)
MSRSCAAAIPQKHQPMHRSLSVMIAIFDVDGTLVDSVKAHAAAWQDVLREFGHPIPFDDIRQQIGKGSDELLKAFLTPQEIERSGETIAEQRVEIFKDQYLKLVRPFPRVREVFQQYKNDGYKIVLATSAKAKELHSYLTLIRVDDLIDGKTSSDDADKSKPHPDILQAALTKVPGGKPEEAIVIGDTPYDAEAAVRGGMKPIGVLTGGFSEQQLREAGCVEVYPEVGAILRT